MVKGYPRPYIPLSLRSQILHHFYGLSQPGRRPTAKLISDRFLWPNMSGDIQQWTQSCNKCQKDKINRHTKSLPGHFNKPDGRFTNLHIDIFGPFPNANRFSYFLIIIVDRFCRRPATFPIKYISTETVARTLL